MNQFPATLRGLRKRARMTQPELAEKLGVSRSAVSMYECGTREPNFAILEALSRIFDVDMNTLTGTPTADPQITDRDIKFALFGDADVSDEVYQAVISFAKFAKERRK